MEVSHSIGNMWPICRMMVWLSRDKDRFHDNMGNYCTAAKTNKNEVLIHNSHTLWLFIDKFVRLGTKHWEWSGHKNNVLLIVSGIPCNEYIC